MTTVTSDATAARIGLGPSGGSGASPFHSGALACLAGLDRVSGARR